jgi:hypothetical protein
MGLFNKSSPFRSCSLNYSYCLPIFSHWVSFFTLARSVSHKEVRFCLYKGSSPFLTNVLINSSRKGYSKANPISFFNHPYGPGDEVHGIHFFLTFGSKVYRHPYLLFPDL